jgi:hypothetical protein
VTAFALTLVAALAMVALVLLVARVRARRRSGIRPPGAPFAGGEGHVRVTPREPEDGPGRRRPYDWETEA